MVSVTSSSVGLRRGGNIAKTTKRRSGRARGPNLVAAMQKHEMRYTAKQGGVKGRAVKKAVQWAGHSRKKIEQVLKTVKKAVRRVAQGPKKVMQGRLVPHQPALLMAQLNPTRRDKKERQLGRPWRLRSEGTKRS